jgi:hypothetical protein
VNNFDTHALLEQEVELGCLRDHGRIAQAARRMHSGGPQAQNERARPEANHRGHKEAMGGAPQGAEVSRRKESDADKQSNFLIAVAQPTPPLTPTRKRSGHDAGRVRCCIGPLFRRPRPDCGGHADQKGERPALQVPWHTVRNAPDMAKPLMWSAIHRHENRSVELDGRNVKVRSNYREFPFPLRDNV